METIEDIIKEMREPMRENFQGMTFSAKLVESIVSDYADRIEKAIVCLTEDKVKKLTVWNEAVDEISKVCAENARLKAEVINKAHEYAELSGENDSLKAALKPVMEVDTYDNPDTYLCFSAVCNAKRIYNEGAK